MIRGHPGNGAKTESSVDKGQVFELCNLVTAPATDDALVKALLAFVNGRDVVISGQPSDGGEYSEPRSRSDVRSAYVESVGMFCATREPLQLLPTIEVRGLRRPVFQVIRLAAAGDAPPPLPANFYRTVASIESEQMLVARPKGYSLAQFMHFPDVDAALARALMLVLDVERPYGEAVSRCKLPSCQCFYLARPNKTGRGGPPNRSFCNSTHAAEYRNSAERKAIERARKHK
jgi:hypothetical protein